MTSITTLFYKRASDQERQVTMQLLVEAMNRIFSYEDNSLEESIPTLQVLYDHIAEKGMEAIPASAVHASVEEAIDTSGMDLARQMELAGDLINTGSTVPIHTLQFLGSFHAEGLEFGVEPITMALASLISSLNEDIGMNALPPPNTMYVLLDTGRVMLSDNEDFGEEGLAAWTWAYEQEGKFMPTQTQQTEVYEIWAINQNENEELITETDSWELEYAWESAEDLVYNMYQDPQDGVIIDARPTGRVRWMARLSAPGYMDATDWTYGDTETEALIGLWSMHDGN